MRSRRTRAFSSKCGSVANRPPGAVSIWETLFSSTSNAPSPYCASMAIHLDSIFSASDRRCPRLIPFSLFFSMDILHRMTRRLPSSTSPLRSASNRRYICSSEMALDIVGIGTFIFAP
ncbi:conserved hypothetical protein (plasmid) [Rhizobium johnstonii 3841]|uniref:Uncharacterized protein n=1 Tax=Rhizobium johnstonii (strain DSM 114642 / LMG 32736 / 3841) TaxID=216596 RepID=Q1M633_RHIJ3|nr:conserved hypothetical protein [Rhizobium johnstonii 3841]